MEDPGPNQEADALVATIIGHVCELDGYTSPDDQPDLLQCKVSELEACIRLALESVTPEPSEDAIDAARYRWLKDHWYDTPLMGHTDAAELDAIIDSQFAEAAIDADGPREPSA